MKVLAISVFVAALSIPTAVCSSGEQARKTSAVPDFTISTTTPDRTIYALVKYLHDHALLTLEQSVIGTGVFRIRIWLKSVEVVLNLRFVGEGVRSEGSFHFGDATADPVVESLVLELQKLGEP
jgi:hypothetical protein